MSPAQHPIRAEHDYNGKCVFILLQRGNYFSLSKSRKRDRAVWASESWMRPLPCSTRFSLWVRGACWWRRRRWRISAWFMNTCGGSRHQRAGENCQLIRICKPLSIPANLQFSGEHFETHDSKHSSSCRWNSFCPSGWNTNRQMASQIHLGQVANVRVCVSVIFYPLNEAQRENGTRTLRPPPSTDSCVQWSARWHEIKWPPPSPALGRIWSSQGVTGLIKQRSWTAGVW